MFVNLTHRILLYEKFNIKTNEPLNIFKSNLIYFKIEFEFAQPVLSFSK